MRVNLGYLSLGRQTDKQIPSHITHHPHNGEPFLDAFYHSHGGLCRPILFGLPPEPTSNPTVHVRIVQQEDDSPGSVGGDEAKL